MKESNAVNFVPFHPKIINPVSNDKDSRFDHDDFGYTQRNNTHVMEFNSRPFEEGIIDRGLDYRSIYRPKQFRPEQNILVILVDFKGKPFENEAAHFETLFFSEGAMPHGSVKEYYCKVSNGKVRLSGTVIGPYTSIGPDPLDTKSVAAEVLHMLKSEGYDFDRYANTPGLLRDKKIVNGIVLVHSGTGRETSNTATDIRSHQGNLREKIDVSLDGQSNFITSYMIVPCDAKIGVCCHELAHQLFGLPDLYDEDHDSGAAGKWCLMGTGCWNYDGEIPAHPSAHCKAYLGWVKVKVLNERGTVALADVKNQHKVFEIWGNSRYVFERFLLEYREPLSGTYDNYIPGGGLLIWHINVEDGVSQKDNHRRMVSLEQADGLSHLSTVRGHYGDSGDPFPGDYNNTDFTNKTKPSSENYDSKDSFVRVTNIKISLKKDFVEFDYSVIG